VSRAIFCLDKKPPRISYTTMQNGLKHRASGIPLPSRLGAIALIVSVSLCATGCSSHIAKPSKALSAAIAPVVDQSASAYRDAVTLDNLRTDYEAVVAYQKKDATYNPRNTPVLLTEKDIQSRLAVLAALQVYSESLIEITKGTDSAELDAATKSAGANLATVGNHLAPSIEKVLGISASSSTSPALSPEVSNGITTGLNALGQVLVNRVVEKQLPGKIVEMDPKVQALCKALSGDIQTLQGIEVRDYDRILNLEKQFIIEDEQAGKFTNPQEHRAEIMKLPGIARQQREASEKLDALREAIDHLAQAHHDLAVEAQENNPLTFKEKLAALASVGSNLGNFYSSLPTN
jgi:hypothetical protein